MSITVNGTNGLTFNDGSAQNTAATGFGFKNRIINGAMMIDQRNAGASVNLTDGVYNLDRYQGSVSQASKVTVQRSSTAPAGFANSQVLTVSSAMTFGAGDYCGNAQAIEGYNVSDLGFGTASAQTVTMSFWVRSSVTGTYSVALHNSAFDRTCAKAYTISASNTWEQKTVTFTGDTSGTWLTNNGTGLKVYFALGMGSTYGGGTDGAWSSTPKLAVTGQTNWASNAGATFYITGVQLEKGSTATSFDYRPYGTELALCQRYYQKSFPQGTAPAQNAGTTGCAFGQSAAASGCAPCWVNFPVVMRATPTTFTAYNPSAANASWRNVSAGTDVNSQLYSSSAASIYIIGNTQTVGQYQITAIHYTVDAEL